MADFLYDNVVRIREFQEGEGRKRAFILDVLLPEASHYRMKNVATLIHFIFQNVQQALIYGVLKSFDVTLPEAREMVVYGLKSNVKSVN